jgi:AhpD family alkylhydroperoxidase
MGLVELVYLRVSQINGCSYCLEKHAGSLRAQGVSEAQLDTLAAWRISPHFSERERAALAWVEAVTDIAGTGAPDSVYDAVRAHFDDKEVVDLSFAAALMNALNRLAISMRM